MNWIGLVLTVCAFSGRPCKEVQVTQVDSTPMQCIMTGIFTSTQWAVEHPGWYVKRWTCKPIGQEADL